MTRRMIRRYRGPAMTLSRDMPERATMRGRGHLTGEGPRRRRNPPNGPYCVPHSKRAVRAGHAHEQGSVRLITTSAMASPAPMVA